MALGGKTAIMHFVGWDVMTVCPIPVGWTEASVAAPLLHSVRQNVFHALIAVQFDDLFYS